MVRGRAWRQIVILLVVFSAAGCADKPADRDFVARVGDHYLTADDVVSALSSVPPGLDSVHAARGIIDRWVTDELLAREARRRNLLDDPEVQRRIADNERSILISSLINRLYDEVEPATESEISAYFERHADNLQLREPFLRIRYLTTRDSAAAVQAVTAADSIHAAAPADTSMGAAADSLWLAIVSEVGERPETSAVLSSSYYPASRLFRNVPDLQQAVASLSPGQSKIIIADDETYHVIQLADRVEAGTRPRMEWIVEELQNRILIDRRKQMYTDQVQRLRNRALAEGLLEISNDAINPD